MPMQAADYLYPDFLRPIGDDNRDEYLLIEFHRTYKNTNFSLMRNIMKRVTEDQDLYHILPNIVTFASLLYNNSRYDATVLYNHPEDLIRFLSKNQLSPEMCKRYADAFMHPLILEHLHTTRLEFAISQLVSHPFIKEIYFFADKFTTEMQGYLVRAFGPQRFQEKIRLVEGSMQECMIELPQITTAFVSNASEVVSLYQEHPEALHKRMIVISDGYDNYDAVDDEASKKDPDALHINYKYLDIFQKLHKARQSEISYAFPFCIESNMERKE